MKIKIAVAFAVTLASLHAQDNLIAATQRYYNPVRRNLEGSADAMAADKYGYRLTPGQMTFAEWLLHSAQRNYADCAAVEGNPTPDAAKELAGLKTKEEVSKALKDSFAFCDAALKSADQRKILASPQTTYSLLHIVVHNNEIYGNIVGYLRSNGIVPPSSAGRGGRNKK